MRHFKRILVVVFIFINGKANAQLNEYYEIQISKIHDYHKKHEERILKINLNDSTFWYQKNKNRRFKKLDKVESKLFIDKQVYPKLDSLIDHFADLKSKEPRKK